MADQRLPQQTLLLKYRGKPATKIELFRASIFPVAGAHFLDGSPIPVSYTRLDKLYRLRVAGSWFPKGLQKTYYTLNQVRALLITDD